MPTARDALSAPAAPACVRIDDFASWSYVNSVRVAPDGARLVYSVITPDLAGNRYANDLWVMDVPAGTRRRLTSSGKEGRFDFMDDGSVLFVSRRAAPASDAPTPAWPCADGAAAPSQAALAGAAYEKTADVLADDPACGCDLYRIALDGGEATPYLHVPLALLDWRQLPEGRLLVRARELSDAAAPYAALEDIPFCENGGAYTSGLRWGLYVVEPPDGAWDAAGFAAPRATVRRLTDADESVDSYALSSDRSCVYLASSVYRNTMPLINELSAIDLATGERSWRVSDPRAAAADPASVPPRLSYALVEELDPATLAVLGSDLALHGINTDPQVYLLDAATGTGMRRVSGDDFDVDFYNHITSDARQGGGQVSLAAGGRLLFAHVDGEASHLSAIDACGAVHLLVGGPGSLDSFDTLDGRTLYYVAMRPDKLPELYTRTVGDPAGETCLTDFSAALGGRAIASCEQFSFESNGSELHGFVVPPAGYDPAAPAGTYPAILWVHGGPKCVMGDVLHHEIQFLSSLGYFVFYTNPHGSGGRGMEYAASIFGRYGSIDFDDLMTFTDEVLRRYPAIDPARVAEMGGSYGGFMTNWIIGHTDRFACCVSQRSISNWISMFGTSDIGYYFADDQTFGWPWNEDESLFNATGRANGVHTGDALREGAMRVGRMWDQSPLKYADKVTTPTLFLHADADYRCPLEQGMQMYTALRLHGVPTRLTVFKGENHDLSRSGKPQARIRRLAEIAHWCARWLKGDERGEAVLRA